MRTTTKPAPTPMTMADAAERELNGETTRLARTVRISLPSIATSREFLQPLCDLMWEHPQLRVQVTVSDRPVNPVAEGLDLAIQGGALADSGLIGRKLTELRPRLAAAASYAEVRGLPKRLTELRQHEALRFMGDRPQDHWVLVGPGRREQVVEGTLVRVLPRYSFAPFPVYASTRRRSAKVTAVVECVRRGFV